MKIPELNINEEDVLKGQGADPRVISGRKPMLFDIARKALNMGFPLLEPVVFHRTLDVISSREGEIFLEDGFSIKSRMINRAMPNAQSVEMVICSIGNYLEDLSAEFFKKDLSLSLAFDGLANAAVDHLVEAVCDILEKKAAGAGMEMSIPVGPGSSEWSLEEGQPLLFQAVKPNPSVIKLNESCLMMPRKSASFMVGLGKNFPERAKSCEYCNLREICRYKIRKEK